MYIKSILAGAAIALVAGVGSVSGNELYVADTAVDPGTPYTVLYGIPTELMSPLEMEGTRGSFVILNTRTGDRTETETPHDDTGNNFILTGTEFVTMGCGGAPRGSATLGAALTAC